MLSLEEHDAWLLQHIGHDVMNRYSRGADCQVDECYTCRSDIECDWEHDFPQFNADGSINRLYDNGTW